MSDDLLRIPSEREYSPEEVHRLLTEQVQYLLKHKRDWLLGKLYRLDVRERDLKMALKAAQADIASGIAQLILDRQTEKQQARNRHAGNARKTSVDLDPDLGDMSW